MMHINPVLESVGSIIEKTLHVKINFEKIKEVATTLKDYKFPPLHYDFLPNLRGDDLVQFTFVFNSINFQFCELKKPWRRFEIKYGGTTYSGAIGLIYSLRKALEDDIPVLDAKYLAKLTEERALKFLKGDNIIIPMFEERVKILREIGKVLLEKYEGSFSNFLKLSNKAFDEGKGLVERLVKDFPSFNDVRVYRPTGTVVKFYKRAQLLFAMLHYNPNCQFKLENVDKLTVFADYRLPQALRDLGIIMYSDKLAYKIDNRIPIPEGSDEEVEIRACTIYSAHLLCEEINRHRSDKITEVILDGYLWLKGKESMRPHHLTRTIHY
ncbi:MAG: hypothetical protein DRN47_02705 [Candidatus Wolframiiraptor sp.]|nr:MAG: hypothetical protein DRN47_02705 [Candidatus Wolframiiraptor sp.]